MFTPRLTKHNRRFDVLSQFEMALVLMVTMLIHNDDLFLIRVLANIVRVNYFFERLDEDQDARWS
jgi:hypothetical protein